MKLISNAAAWLRSHVAELRWPTGEPMLDSPILEPPPGHDPPSTLPLPPRCSYRMMIVPRAADSEAMVREVMAEGADITGAELVAMADMPLAPLPLDKFGHWVKNETPFFHKAIPFDLSAHPRADTPVAKDILCRLETDLATYAQTLTRQTEIQITLLAPHLKHASSPKACSAAGKAASALRDALVSLHSADADYVDKGMACVVSLANSSHHPHERLEEVREVTPPTILFAEIICVK